VRPERDDLKLYDERLSRNTLAIIAGIVILIVAMVIALVTGGGEVEELTGDLTYVPGKSNARPGGQGAPLATTIADVVEAEVQSDGSDFVFSAEVAAPIPKKLRRAALGFRWDISTQDGEEWIVSAVLRTALNATVFSSTTNLGAGTKDGTLPGNVRRSGKTVIVRFAADQIEGFPTRFDWTLSTAVVAFRKDPRSARAEDHYPDEGMIGFEA
jgi:hypothetical protein